MSRTPPPKLPYDVLYMILEARLLSEFDCRYDTDVDDDCEYTADPPPWFRPSLEIALVDRRTFVVVNRLLEKYVGWFQLDGVV